MQLNFFNWITNYPHSTQSYHWQKSELESELIWPYQFLSVWLCLTQNIFLKNAENQTTLEPIDFVWDKSQNIFNVPQKIQPKWKVLSSFMHLCIVLNPYEFLSFVEQNRWDFEESWELNYIEGHWLPLRSFSKYILCFTEEQSFWKNVNRKNSFSGEHLSLTFALFIIESCQFRLVSWSERRPFIFHEFWCY